MSPVDSAFAPLLKIPSWSVRKGHGSFVTLEFGDPVVTIGEKRSRVLRLPDRDPLTVRARESVVHGAWHLLIWCCVWRLEADEVEIAHCESDDTTIARSLKVLNGQAPTEVQVDPTNGATRFDFDLGCRLNTHPAPPDWYDEDPIHQWMLYQPDGTVLSVRSNGSFAVAASSEPDSPNTWTQLPG